MTLRTAKSQKENAMSRLITNVFHSPKNEVFPRMHRAASRRRHDLMGSASRGYSRALRVEMLEDRMLLTSYVVNTPLDDPGASPDDVDGRVSLREAIMAANSNAPFGDAPAGQGDGLLDSITFRPSLKGKTIVLGGAELPVGDHLSITGLGSDKLTISGNHASRVFSIAAGITVDISGVTIADGAAQDGGGIYNEGTLTVANSELTGNEAVSPEEADDPAGGGIYNKGTLTVRNCAVTNNSARRADDRGGFGGGIWSDSSLTVTDSDFWRNSSRHCGGGIYNLGTLDITNGTFRENTTRVNGGGVAIVGGSLTVTGSEFKNNSAHTGGGIDNWGGEIEVSDCVFTANETDTGAAIWTDGPANITSTRFETNHARWWGGAINHQVSAMTVTNCTFEGNRASEDWGGAIFTRYSELKVFNTTFSGNFAGSEGGAIESWVGNLELANSTISGNSSNGEGGGIYNAGVLNITNSTIFGNRADADGDGSGTGGGLWNYPAYQVQILNNTVLAGNVRGSAGTENESPDDIHGTVDPASRHNLIGDAATAGGLVDGVNGNIVGNGGSGTIDITAVLDPHLVDNGGPTKTHALMLGGLAANAGDNSKAVDAEGNPLLYDQRGEGFARIYDGTVDIGAFEVQPQILSVEIDVKPGSDPNSINLASNGVIAVAIFTTDDFDAALVDASTVVFAGASAVCGAPEDVDGDGDLDMVLYFRVQDTNLPEIYAQWLAQDPGSSHQQLAVSLTGETIDGEAFLGTDAVDAFFSGKALRDLLRELGLA